MINGRVAGRISFRTQLETTLICCWLMCTWLHVVEAVTTKEKTNSIMSCKQSLSDSIFRHQTDTSNIASTLFKCLLLCSHRSIHVLSATFVTNDCQTDNDMTEFSKKKCFHFLIDFSSVRCFIEQALNLTGFIPCSLQHFVMQLDFFELKIHFKPKALLWSENNWMKFRCCTTTEIVIKLTSASLLSSGLTNSWEECYQCICFGNSLMTSKHLFRYSRVFEHLLLSIVRLID